MGCAFSNPDSKQREEEVLSGGRRGFKKLKRPTWNSDKPVTAARLAVMRQEFWETAPAYGGDRVIWDALKAACEADLETAQLILESAGIIVAAADMSQCYDERGAKYDLPNYVLSNPSNVERS